MKKLFTLGLMLTAFCGVSMADDVYRVVGSSSVLGSEWNTSDDNNVMSYDSSTGLYTLTKSSVKFSAGDSFTFKVCKNGSWDYGNYGASGSNDAYYKVTTAGTYDVTFVCNPNGYNDQTCYVGCIVKGDDMKLITSTDGGSNWTVSSNTVTWADNAYSVSIEGTEGMLFALVPAADASDSSISGDEWRRLIRPTTSSYYNAYIQHASDTAIPFDTNKVWYVSEAGTYTFSYYPGSNSFTIDAVATFSMGSEGWRTFSTGNYTGSNGYIISGDNVTAYYVSGLNGDKTKATFAPIASGAVIPTKEGILLNGSGTFTVTTTSTTGTELTDNMLVGSGSSTPTLTYGTDYILAGSGSTLGFYPISSSDNVLSSHKAYLSFSGESRTFSFIAFDDKATGIDAVRNDSMENIENGTIYNLSGQRVSDVHKAGSNGGIFIVNGKKMIVK